MFFLISVAFHFKFYHHFCWYIHRLVGVLSIFPSSVLLSERYMFLGFSPLRSVMAKVAKRNNIKLSHTRADHRSHSEICLLECRYNSVAHILLEPRKRMSVYVCLSIQLKICASNWTLPLQVLCCVPAYVDLSDVLARDPELEFTVEARRSGIEPQCYKNWKFPFIFPICSKCDPIPLHTFSSPFRSVAPSSLLLFFPQLL